MKKHLDDYDFIEDVEAYENENRIDLGFEDDFADDEDFGVYHQVKNYKSSKVKDLYEREDWVVKRDRLLINLRHELNLCKIENEKDKEEYYEYWKNPNSLNKKINDDDEKCFIPWLPEGEKIGSENCYGRRIVKSKYHETQRQKPKPFNFVINSELRKEIRKKYDYVSTKEDEKTVIYREYNLDDKGKRQKHPLRFKFVDSLQTKMDEDGNVKFNDEQNKFYFSNGDEHIFNEKEDIKTIELEIKESDYKVDDEGEKTKAYDTIPDTSKGDKGFEGYEVELMYGSFSLVGRKPDIGRKKVNGKYKPYQLWKEVRDENGKLISKDKKWLNHKLRKNVKDNQGEIIKRIPIPSEELQKCIQGLVTKYEGENKKERFRNLIDVMAKERAEAKARAEAINKVNEDNAAEDSPEETTVNE